MLTCVICWSLFVVCGLWFNVCVCCLWCVACCLLLFDVCCVGVRCLRFGVVCRVMFVQCLPFRLLYVV